MNLAFTLDKRPKSGEVALWFKGIGLEFAAALVEADWCDQEFAFVNFIRFFRRGNFSLGRARVSLLDLHYKAADNQPMIVVRHPIFTKIKVALPRKSLLPNRLVIFPGGFRFMIEAVDLMSEFEPVKLLQVDDDIIADTATLIEAHIDWEDKR